MRNLYDKFMKDSMIRAVLLGVMGILALIFPQFFLNAIVYIIAGYVILNGVLNIIRHFRSGATSWTAYNFVSGCVLVVLGILMMIFSRQLISILPVFLGVLMVLGGVAYLAGALQSGRRRSWLLIALSIFIIIGGIVVLFNPFGSAVTLFRIFGVLMILSCVDELVTYFTYR